jgi:hypothetical protein
VSWGFFVGFLGNNIQGGTVSEESSIVIDREGFEKYLNSLSPLDPRFAVRNDSSSCPLAKYLSYKGASRASVGCVTYSVAVDRPTLRTPGWASIYIKHIDGSGERYSYVTPAEAKLALSFIP